MCQYYSRQKGEPRGSGGSDKRLRDSVQQEPTLGKHTTLPHAWSLSLISCRSVRSVRAARFGRRAYGTRLDGYPVLAAVRTGIPEGSKPLAGGKRSHLRWMMSQDAQKGLPRRGRALQNVRFCDRTGRQRRKKASIPPPHRAGTVPGFSSMCSSQLPFVVTTKKQ